MYFSQMHTSAWLLGQTNSSWILMGEKTEQRAVIGQVWTQLLKFKWLPSVNK